MTGEQEKTERFRKLRPWLMVHGSSIMLITTGLLFVTAAVWAVDGREAVSTVLVLFGAGMVIIGALLPRIEGLVTFSLQQGLKFTLAAGRAAERKAAERHLSPEKTEVAVDMAIEAAAARSVKPSWTRMLSHRADAIISAPTAESIATEAIERVIDLDAAREERRQMGQDVEHEPGFGDIQKKLDIGDPLTPEEQAALDRLFEAMKHLLKG